MRGTASSPLTIVDPTGRLSLKEVQEFVQNVRGDLPLRVIAVGNKGDHTVFHVDLEGAQEYSYHDEEMNHIMILFMQEFLPRGCEFTECPEVCAYAHARTSRGVR